jgi:hypothetical protein
MVNNSYNSSKSYGVTDFAIQHVAIGTSSKNSFDFVKIEMSVHDNDNIKTYNLRVDGELIKQAHYNTKTKKMEVEDVKTSNFVQSENTLKVKYFKKWKDEDEAKDQAFRNERLAHRQAVNGH